MFKINNLEVATDNKIILKDFNLIINDGEIHTIMGPNGVGKSTLSRVIMGDPNYKVLNGEMTFNGDNLMVLSTDERAKKGIFLAMQYPMEIEGVSNQDFLGVVEEYNEGYAIIRVKNYFKVGDTIEFMSPKYKPLTYKIEKILDIEDNNIDVCRHPEDIIKLPIKEEVYQGDMIRVKI